MITKANCSFINLIPLLLKILEKCNDSKYQLNQEIYHIELNDDKRIYRKSIVN